MKVDNLPRLGAACVAAALLILCACRPGADDVAAAAPQPTVAAAKAEAAATPEIAPPAQTAASPRLTATAHVASATVMRVDGAAAATPGPRLAGYLIRSNTERQLEAQLLQQLVTLVRSDANFDDSIIKRCRPGVSVGFRLVHDASTSELVLDFGCNKLAVKHAQVAGDGYSTNFDPSRSEFIALARSALPQDAELRGLR